MRRKSVDEQLIEMEREDRVRLTRDRIRLALTNVMAQAAEAYGPDDPLTIAIHEAWRISVGMPT